MKIVKDVYIYSYVEGEWFHLTTCNTLKEAENYTLQLKNDYAIGWRDADKDKKPTYIF